MVTCVCRVEEASTADEIERSLQIESVSYISKFKMYIPHAFKCVFRERKPGAYLIAVKVCCKYVMTEVIIEL